MSVWGRLRQEFIHAFALAPAEVGFAPEETALLEKVSRLIVKQGMAVPALLFLESLERAGLWVLAAPRGQRGHSGVAFLPPAAQGEAD